MIVNIIICDFNTIICDIGNIKCDILPIKSTIPTHKKVFVNVSIVENFPGFKSCTLPT